MIKTDVTIADKRVGDTFIRTFRYYEDDGITPDNPTTVTSRVRKPDGTEAAGASGVQSGDDWTVTIALNMEGDWFIEVRANWATESQSVSFYLYVNEAI